jgi:ABC-type spermidine/putrescine transport system permease subunit II
VITYFIIGAQITLPIYIYTQIKFGITPAINAVATLLIVGSLTIAALGVIIPRSIGATSRYGRRRLRARRERLAGAGLTGPAPDVG